MRRRRRRLDVIDCVILEPIPFVDGVIPNVVIVWDEEFDKEFPVLEARWVEGDRILKCNANKAPFTVF